MRKIPNLKYILFSVITIFIFLISWEIVASHNLISSKLFPPPSEAANTLIIMFKNGELLADIIISLKRVFIGFLIGTFLGVILGIVTGRIKWGRYSIGSLLQLFRSIPAIALVPFTILWLGIGETAKYFLVSWGVFFPVWVNTHLGISGVEEKYIWIAKSLGAKRKRVLFEVILPAAAPFIIAGMRIGIGIAYIMLIAAEMAGAFKGIGFRINISHNVFRVDKMVVALSMLGILGAFTDKLFTFLIGILLPWYSKRNIKRNTTKVN